MDDPPPPNGDFLPEPISPGLFTGIALVFEGGLGVLAWLLSLLFGSPPLADFRWTARDALVGALAMTPMAAVLWTCLRWPVGPLAQIKEISEQVIGRLFSRCSSLQLALMAFAAGVGEEMLFRGFLQAALEARYGWVLGLVVASLLFGATHLITPTYALLATALGAYLGGLWLWSGNILAAIVAHALYDFLALVYLTKTALNTRES